MCVSMYTWVLMGNAVHQVQSLHSSMVRRLCLNRFRLHHVVKSYCVPMFSRTFNDLVFVYCQTFISSFRLSFFRHKNFIEKNWWLFLSHLLLVMLFIFAKVYSGVIGHIAAMSVLD